MTPRPSLGVTLVGESERSVAPGVVSGSTRGHRWTVRMSVRPVGGEGLRRDGPREGRWVPGPSRVSGHTPPSLGGVLRVRQCPPGVPVARETRPHSNLRWWGCGDPTRVTPSQGRGGPWSRRRRDEVSCPCLEKVC